jgi:hypothetical protein
MWNRRIMASLAIQAAVCTASAVTAQASLTLLPAGPMIGSHVGNLVTGGSFETAGTNIGSVYWATGTSGTPFAVPPGWTSSGVTSNYAQWGTTSLTPPSIVGSAAFPHGTKGLYFGNGQGATTTVLPTYNTSGEVTFSSTPTISTSIGGPVVLSQTVNTPATPAPAYVLSFWVSGENAATGSAADGLFGLRVTNTQSGDPMRYFVVPGSFAGPFGDQKRFEFNFVPLNPLLPVTLEFYNWGHFNFSGGTSELVLDDVIVNPLVPEPASFATLSAIAAVLGRRRRLDRR